MGLKRLLIQGFIMGIVAMPSMANEGQKQDDSVYQDKQKNIVVSRTKEEESLFLKEGIEVVDTLEGLSLGDVIIVDDSPKPASRVATNPPQPVVCNPKITNDNGKITKGANTCDNTLKPTPQNPVVKQTVSPADSQSQDTSESSQQTGQTVKSPQSDFSVVVQDTPEKPLDNTDNMDNTSNVASESEPTKTISQDTTQNTQQNTKTDTKTDTKTNTDIKTVVNTDTNTLVNTETQSAQPTQGGLEDIVVTDVITTESITTENIITEDIITEDIISEKVVLNTETHEQMVARLADEADFFYTFGGPHKVFYPIPSPFPKPEPQITLLQADTIGLYSPKTGGIVANYWQGYAYLDILNALQNADVDSSSYVYTQVMNRLILSGTPVPKTTKQAGEIFAYRLQYLMNTGRLLDAQKLLDTIPYKMRISRYADTLAQIHIAYFDNASLCGLWYMQPDNVKKQAFWERTNILCLTLDGNWNGVQQAFKSAQNPLPQGLQQLVAFGLKGTDIPDDTRIDMNIWTVHLMRALGFGVDVPVDADMASYYGLLQNLAVPDDQRAYYAYELFKQRALPASFVGVVYETVSVYEPMLGSDEMPFDVAIEPYIMDIRYADIPYHLRALSYQQAMHISQMDISTPNTHTESLIQVVLNQINAETEYTNRMTTIRLFAPFLTQIPAYKHVQSKRIAGILYASGHYDSAEKWAVYNPMELWYERILYQILKSAPEINHNKKPFTGNKGGCDTNTLDPREWMQYIADTDPKNAVYRISEAFMTLETLGCQVDISHWEKLATMTSLLIQDIIAPAHMRTLQAKYDRATSVLPVLRPMQMFVERVDISHMEMAKVYAMLYDMGYGKLATEIAYERNTYNPW